MSDNQIKTQTAANFYTQNAAKNPVFLEKIDNRHQPVMPFDDFVIAAMKDTGDSREEVIAFASEAFRSQYQAADGYLRAAHDSSTMYNAFDIEIDDKTYYATAPLEWVKEQARVGLSDRGWELENARHNFLHSSLDEWETAFHQLKAAADDYKQWRNQVCAFFNFRQPEKENQMEQTTQTAEKGGIFMAEPVLAEKTAEEMKEIINDLLQQRSEQMGNKHMSSDIATLMVYVQKKDNPTAEETQAVKDLGVVKNFVENNMQYKKWYAPTPQDEIRRLQRKIDANFELQREYLAMGDEKGANAITVQIAILQEKQQSLGLQLPDNAVKHDMNGLPETAKTLSLQEQALADGKRLQQADEKVKSAEWECAKKPNIKEPYNNLQAAIAERDALNEEIKPRVQAAMDSGKPYIVDYSEDGKPLELVVTQNGNLKMALGSYDEEPNHNYLLSTANGEVALNAEQRSTPERVAEVLKYNFNHKHSDIGEKLALINYPNADKVFSENQIKDTLNKALRSSFKDIRLDAIKSPVMRGEWLSQIADNSKATKELRQAAKSEMTERYGKSKPQGQAEKQSLKPTAANGGVFLSAPQQHTTQQPVVAKQVMQPQTTVKSHRMRH